MNVKQALMSSLMVLSLAAPAAADGGLQVDGSIPTYKRTSGVSGSLSSIGSDTLNNLMTLWAEGFRSEYPSVRIQIEGKGSSTAPAALISGTAQLGPMSRPMKSSEIDEFEKVYGYKPTAIGVALDALAVYVNKDNPIAEMSLEEVDAVFSSNRACGYPSDIRMWNQLGLSGTWGELPISIYGRNSASGTYGYFKEHALCKGDFRPEVKEQPGSASVVEGVTNDRAGIGYSGFGYKTAGVKAVALSSKGGKAYGATPENVYSGDYPMSRYLYIYINKKPGEPLDPLVREFMTFVLSRGGQEVVLKDGYIPLVRQLTQEEVKKLQ